MKINPQIILSLIDFFQKTSVRKYYNFYCETITWDRKKIKEYQLSRLKELLHYAKENVPYYRDIIKFDIGKMSSVSELSSLPVLTRDDIQKYNMDLISKKVSGSSLEKSSSSGTTGIPITYYKDKDAVSAGIAAGYSGYKLSGWKPGDKTLHIWGNPTSIVQWNRIPSRIKRKLKNQLNIASTEFNDPANLEGLYKYISGQQCTAIDGYTTAIYELAEYIRKNNLPQLNAKYVFTTAENLAVEHRSIIEKYIGGVSDIYGCGEINGVASQRLGSDRYNIIDTHVIVETEDNGMGFKNILITDLDNKAMPFIRYKVGDLIDDIYEPDPGDKVQLSYFKEIAGRDSDIIVFPDGKKILPVNILGGTLFRKIGGIIKHKVTWDGTELVFHFEINNDFNLTNASELIQHEFKPYKIKTKIEIADKLLPDVNGKFRYFEKIDKAIAWKYNL